MRLHFTKMQGAGNDFVVFDARQARPADDCDALDPAGLPHGTLAALADRRTGIGCDQILLLEDPRRDHTVAYYRIFNRDGSEVQQCGNGARCLARYLADNDTQGSHINLDSPGGIVQSRILPGGVSVSLGVPNFEPSALPFEAARADSYQLTIDEQPVHFGAVSLGNPHAVLIVDDTLEAPVARLGAALGSHAAFPEGVNVGFAQISGRELIKLRVFERGVGETKACGTGAAAAAAVAMCRNLVDNSVKIDLPGGQLMVSWAARDEPLWLSGPASKVFEGYINL